MLKKTHSFVKEQANKWCKQRQIKIFETVGKSHNYAQKIVKLVRIKIFGRMDENIFFKHGLVKQNFKGTVMNFSKNFRRITKKNI